MKQVLIKKGIAFAADVPAPQVDADKVLVKVINSCISIGTEMSGITNSGKSLWQKAKEKPQNVQKVINKVKEEGLGKTINLVKSKLDAELPVGYSAAGTVIAIGRNVRDIKVGDRVGCAGAQCAHHAEIINVPRNLIVKIPDDVSFADASVVTLGSIALQGVRRANPTLGECFVVIGLGVIGQLTVQMLKANGCKVIVSDLDDDRIAMALKHGADFAIHPGQQPDVLTVEQLTGGIGADGVIITAAARTDSIIHTAFQMCRRKARVVCVGAVGLGIDRNDIYEKELDFFISTSYGPGRYDEAYEEKGLEYPVGYVRWTENRNLQEVLSLMSQGKLQVTDMVSAIYPVEQASKAYGSLKTAMPKPLMVLLSYADNNKDFADSKIALQESKPHAGKIRLAVVGAGNFAKSMHLPNIMALKNIYHLRAIMSRTGANAKNIAQQFGADYATTSYEDVLSDETIDAVLITTRHNLHKDMVLAALKAGKHVLVEKPLAVNRKELAEIEDYMLEHPQAPLLLTGFNRRHSQYLKEVARHTEKRINPMIINYRMNAGYIPLDVWVHTEEGAGRNIGEACHIYDLFNFLTGARPVSVSAHSVAPHTDYYSGKDNFVASISYADGSVANLIYTAMGNKEYPKETMEVFFDGKMIVLDDYKKLQGYGVKIRELQTKSSDKGQLEEIAAFAQAIQTGAEPPVTFEEQVTAMNIAFAVEEQI